MSKLLFTIVFGVSLACHAGDGLFWAASTNSAGVYFYRATVSTPGAAQAVESGTALKYLRLVNGAIMRLSAAQQAAQDAQEAADAQAAYVAATNAAAIQAAINASNELVWAEMQVDLAQAIAIEKGVAFCTMDQLNLLRAWVVDFKAAVSNSTSLANLQTRVAALPTFLPITTNGLKTAVRARAQEFQ